MTRCPSCHRRLATGAPCPVDGARPPHAGEPLLPPPPPAPGYTLDAPLGAGGFATVYAATRAADGAAVALKIAHGAAAAPRFAREAAALRKIGAPHVPSLLDEGILDDGRPYLVLELLRGRTLADELAARSSPFPPAEARRLIEALLEPLAAAHALGHIHRDLKPENIFLTAEGMRLLDFGLVRADDADAPGLTRAGTAVGTAEYAPPEQLRGDEAGPAADVYGVGVVLYELLTLRPPFVGERAGVVHGHLALRPSPLEEAGGLDEVARACLAKDPARRPRDAVALRDLLGRSSTAAAPRPPASSSGGVTRRPGEMRPAALLFLDTRATATELAAVARARRGIVARTRGAQALLAFTGLDGDDPIAAAVSAAEDVAAADPDARAALHVSPVLVRHAERRAPAVYGDAVDRMERWLPRRAWTGLLLTEAAGTAGAAATAAGGLAGRPVPDVDGFYRLSSEAAQGDAAPLVGREEVLRALREGLAACFGGGPPALTVVIGERGVGKSRLAREAGAIARTTRPDALVLVACARAGPAGDEVARALYAGMGLAPRTTAQRSDAVRALGEALRARAGDGPVAVLIDDADLADDTTREALEFASLAGPPLPLWIAVFGREPPPRAFGERAGRRVRIDLGPLEPAAAATLAGELLRPAQRVPAAILARLAGWVDGNPLQLTELALALRREGIVRQHPGSDTWYLAADELDRLPPSPARQWLAGRELDSLPRDLADLARLAAILGPEPVGPELEEVQRGLEAAGAADRVGGDASVGMAELVARRLVRCTPRGWAFRTAALQEAIYALTPADLRARVHDLAFRWWRTCAEAAQSERLASLAHHGARGGHVDEAVTAYLALGAAAQGRHAHGTAETMFTAALTLLGGNHPRTRLHALAERGRVRRLLTHYEDARADYDAAAQLAEELGDIPALVNALVGESAVCDFTEQLGEAARLIERAREIAGGPLPPAIQARLYNWLGVARAREQRYQDAVELLTFAVALAAAHGDHDTQLGSLLMLGSTLLLSGRRDPGVAALDRAVALAEAAGDSFHQVVGLINRLEAWRQRGDVARARADGERIARLAYEHGYAQLEIWGHYNTSAVLVWLGDLEGALVAARRAHDLSVERFRDEPVIIGSLQCAWLLAHAGRLEEARAILSRVRAEDAARNPSLALTLQACRLATENAAATRWEDLLEQARRTTSEQSLVELLWLRAAAAAARGDLTSAEAALSEAIEEAQAHGAPVTRLLVRDRELVRLRQA